MDSSELLEFLGHAQQGRYVTVAALCLVLHDHLFTCRQEWKFIWIRKWSFSKILFFLSRYGTLGILVFDLYVALNGGTSDHFCTIWFCFQSWSGFYSAVVIEAVLIFRIYAMYHGEKRLMYTLAGLFACQLAVMAYVLQAGCRALTAMAEHLPGVQHCVATDTFTYEWAYWAALLLFETLLFILSLRKAHEHIRQYTFRFEELLISRRVGEVLIRDGVMYFPFIFLSYLVNLLLFALSPRYLAQIAPHAALALRSVLTNRLLLNVSRKFYYPNAGEAHGNDQDGEGRGELTGRDSVLGFVIWASPTRHGLSRSQVALDTDTVAGGEEDGAGRRGPDGGMRLVRGRGLMTEEEIAEDVDDEEDIEHRQGTTSADPGSLEAAAASEDVGRADRLAGRSMDDRSADSPRASATSLALGGDPLGVVF